jgi:DNA-binding NarL/FixJ family response regulator
MSVDDHPLMRDGIAALIRSQPDMVLVAEAGSGSDAIAAFRRHKPDVTLMDLLLPDMSGIDALSAIRAEFAEARVVMLTTFEGDADIQRAMRAGARGYLLKSMPPDELADGIRDVHDGSKRIPPVVAAQIAAYVGEQNLTAREVEVLERIAAGNRNRVIGERLYITEETVKVHVRHIIQKLGASDRTEAVSIGLRRGIIRLK